MKSLLTWLALGLAIRLILIPLTLHPDIRGHYLGAYFITRHGAFFSVYDFISRLPRDDVYTRLYGDNFLVYSPLTYWFHAAVLSIESAVIPWGLFVSLEQDIGAAIAMPGIPWLLYLLKLPYLLIDALGLWFLLKIVREKHRLQACILWVLNLPLIYSAYMMGQFDTFLVVSILAAVYFSKSDRPVLGAVALAVGAGFKPFPLFLVPFLPGLKIKNIFAGLFTYFLIILPYLPSPGFRQYALLAQHTDKMWYAGIPISGSQYLSLFMVGYVFIFWMFHYFPKKLPVWGWLLAVLLLFYSVTHYHPQWFAWISPLLILAAVNSPRVWLPVSALVACWVGVVLSFEPSLNLGLFGLPGNIFREINRFYPADRLVSFIRSAFAATSLALLSAIQSHETPKD